MTRRERASSVTRAFRAPRRSQLSQRLQSLPIPQSTQKSAPLLLESLFDSAPESWIALLPQPPLSQHLPQGEVEVTDS
ncbi:MAG: hypothetical protein ACKO3O_07115, partial [Gammaproteobacteria bacterium]